MIHDFYESLAESEEISKQPFLHDVLRQVIPNYKDMILTEGPGWAQEGGIDLVAHTAAGAQIWIDMKFRGKDYEDVLLETWSNVERGTPGWIKKDLACDYVCYLYLPSQKGLFLPFPALRRAWVENGTQWEVDYGTIEAQNRGYTTVSIPVPKRILMPAIGRALRIDWNTPEK